MPIDLATKKEIIRHTWNFEATGRVPYTIEIGQPHFATKAFFGDNAAEVAWHKAYHANRQGVVDFDMLNIKPNLGIATIAAAFGCQLRVNDEADPWAKTLINRDCRGKVYEQAQPDPVSNPIFQRARDRITYLQKNGDMSLCVLSMWPHHW